MSKNQAYRYPGVRPFATQDSDIFFGRDDDKNKLYRIIMLEKLIVLFGKSGQGKSSLISAGLVPMLNTAEAKDRFRYSPVEVRVGMISGKNETPIEKVILKLNTVSKNEEQWSFLDKYEDIPEMWREFKKKQFQGECKFLLIFDQFEEFFNYPKDIQEAFRWELAELLYTDIPQKIRENPEEITDEQIEMLSASMDIKVLISIRSDRLSLMHSMKDALPRILDTRFEIKGLSNSQAIEAIKLPALLNDEKFVTHPFTYDDKTMSIILRELSKIQSDGSESIEAFHLQIICQGCESRIWEKLKKGVTDAEVNEEDLPVFENLYDEYYNRQIANLPHDIQASVQSLLEEGLIYEDEQTGEFHRLSVDGNILRKQISDLGLKGNVLKLLEDTFLIRREVNNVGGFSYEISHDTIVYPIIRKKEERKLQLITNAQKKWLLKKVRKQLVWFICAFLLLIMIVWKWQIIYFGYQSVVYDKDRPAIRLTSSLNSVITNMEQEINTDIQTFGANYKTGSWTAAQLTIGLGSRINDTIKNNFFLITSKSIVDSCCCWREFVNYNDIRTSSWIVSVIAKLDMTSKYRCNLLNFFLDNQLDNGAWSMLPIDKKKIDYSSTYATCHVIRAMHNALPGIKDARARKQIKFAIGKAAKWLIDNRHDSTNATWQDYPNNNRKEGSYSLSISGLAMHTLNLIHHASPQLNKQWLSNLKSSQSFYPIHYREQSDVFYFLDSNRRTEATTRDATRHLVVPWQIIAIVDAYKDGSSMEKFNTNIWLDNMISNLVEKDIADNQMFIKAEIYIALKYLQDENFRFQ